jgi:hypothetical protein
MESGKIFCWNSCILIVKLGAETRCPTKSGNASTNLGTLEAGRGVCGTWMEAAACGISCNDFSARNRAPAPKAIPMLMKRLLVVMMTTSWEY